MAKKKRRRHRRPVAPPVHSAPQTLHGPPSPPPPAGPPPARPVGAEPPIAPDAAEAAMPVPASRPRQAPRRQAPRREPPRRTSAARRQRQRRIRNITIGTLVAIAVIGLIAFQRIQTARTTSNFNKITAAAGCGDVRTVGDLSREHANGERIKYKTSPPVGGAHYDGTVSAGVYDKPLSQEPTKRPNIYEAAHSLEHGYVIIWYDGLKDDEILALDRAVRNQKEVILIPYRQLKEDQKVAMTAWGHLQYCSKPGPEAVEAFIERYLNARSAPEASIP